MVQSSFLMHDERKTRLIVGGTCSANRVCRSNPASNGKSIHLYLRYQWLTVGTGTIWAPERRQQHWNNTAGALIKATSYFHHHASEDICIAALPKGTLTQQAGLPQHQHNETGLKSVYACEETRRNYTLPFRSQAARVGVKNTEGLSLMEIQIRRHSFRGLHRGKPQREIFTGYTWDWMEFSWK